MPGDHSLPSSPALPVKQTRSFDDRECLRAVTSAVETVATNEPPSDSCKGVESVKSDENISLHCEINEPNNTNIRHENISAVQQQQQQHHSSANPNASDTNLESSSCLSDDGGKVHSETIALSASPPTITVICAPCTDDILAETAAQQHTEQPIDCDVGAGASDSEETAQTVALCSKNDSVDEMGTGAGAQSSSASNHAVGTQHIQLTLEVNKANEEVTVQQEDLSPSMDEYQECNPTISDYLYDSIAGEMLVPGCVAPAPTPSPLIAPLAEIEIDPPDDETPVSGNEKPQQSSEATAIASDNESTAKTSSQHHQQSAAQPHSHQHQPHTSHTKKKKQKSTDKGERT